MEVRRTFGIIQAPKDISQSTIEKVLQSYYESDEVKVLEISNFTELGGGNDFVNSEIKKIWARVQLPEEGEKILHLVVKSTRTSSFFHKQFSKVMHAFATEALLYSRALPLFGQHSPVLYDIGPKCFYGYSSCIDERFDNPGCCEQHCCKLCAILVRNTERGILILEDLTQSQEGHFQMHPKIQVLSPEHVKAAFRKLAHFHGSWYRYLKGDGIVSPYHEDEASTFSPISLKEEGLVNPALLNPTLLKLHLKQLFVKVLLSFTELLKNRKVDPEIIAKYNTYIKRAWVSDFTMGFKKITNSEYSQFKTLQHGDFWSNNMMFNDDDPSNIKVKIFDFQMMAVSPPFYDLGYFLYVSTDPQFRKNHEAEVLKEYYTVFSSYAKPGVLPDFQFFLEKYRELLPLYLFGIVVASNMLSPTKKKNMKDYKEITIQEMSSPDKEDDHPDIRILRQRIVDTVLELHERGLF